MLQEAQIWDVGEDAHNIGSLKILHVLIGPDENQMRFSLVLAQQDISIYDPKLLSSRRMRNKQLAS